MERTPLVKVQDRVKSWINPKRFDVVKLRDILLGNVLSATIGEVCSYRLLLQDVRGGELPSYVPGPSILCDTDDTDAMKENLHEQNPFKIFSLDILIVALSALEAIAAPFVSWLGFRKRRFILVTYTLVVLLSSVLLYFLPSATIREESEFCDAANSNNDISYKGMSARSIVRLTIITAVAMTFQLSRITSWAHGLAYCEEYAPERISVHYGVLLLGRVVVLVLGVKMVTGLIEGLLPVQVSLLIFGYLINLVKYFCVMPEHPLEVTDVQSTEHPLHGRGRTGLLDMSSIESVKFKSELSSGFPMSILRVVSRSVVLAVAMSASLLAAALWGVGYNRDSIVKVNFLITASTSMSFDVILRHMYIVMPIALAGVKFSAPVLSEYSTKKALKQTIIMTTFVFIFFILFTVLPKCDQGSVAGLGDNNFNYPECSLSCGCKPKWAEFNPVCVTDNMTTFLSPCHAGCSGTENINGLQVYTKCKCSRSSPGSAGAGSVLPGACATDCRQQHILHDMLFIVATTFTLLALQAQGVLILKVVDPRDKSVAMGVLLAMIALVTFVCGHIMFVAIRVTTCQWYEGGECHLQNTLFPYVVGFCSSFLVLLSAAISIASLVFTRVYEKNQFSVNSL